MNRVVVESPLAGIKKARCKYCGYGEHGRCFATECELDPNAPSDFKKAIRYAQLCLLDSLRRGEAPFASHLLYTQVLDDREPDARRAGMEAGFAWVGFADVCALYVDFGVSPGMERGAALAESVGISVERRRLPPEQLLRVDEDPSMWRTL